MADNEAASKTEEPTGKRLGDARAKGDVAKTAELPQLASLALVFTLMIGMGGYFARNMAVGLTPFLAHPDSMYLGGGGGQAVLRMALMAGAPVILAALVGAGLCGAAGTLLQTGLIFSAEKLKPDLAKLNPIENAKKMFNVDGVVQFLKSLIKIFVTGTVAWTTLQPHAHEMAGLAALDITAILPLALTMTKSLFWSVLTFLALTAVIDWLWQRSRFHEKMKMTKEEVKDEHKQSDGDPHVKARQRQIRMERARRRMMHDVAKATVVVMNPTHYAVALKYEAGTTAAPLCVGKGMDSLALKIRAIAEENGVTVVEDPPLARALYAAVEIDQEIPEAHFQAVAKIIGFVLNRAKKPRAAALR
jgi:flagellar biosynthesis protein FlhB